MFDSTEPEDLHPIVMEYEDALNNQDSNPSVTKSKYAKISQSQSLDLGADNKLELSPMKKMIHHDANVSSVDVIYDENDDGKQPNQPPVNNRYTKALWHKLFTDLFCWLRMCQLIFIIFLLIVARWYCMAQLYEIKLDIITECPKPKTREHIWQHSYDTYIKNGRNVNEESQFGYTNDKCWTTRQIDVNTHKLWENNINPYKAQLKNTGNTYYNLFGVIFIYFGIIILFDIVTIAIDIIRIKKNSIHTKSSLFIKYFSSRQLDENVNDNFYKKLYTKYLRNDTTGWIIMKLAAQFTQLIIQSLALLLYNGYNVFDSNNENNVYLANDSQIIITFAAILCFNYIGAGFLWLLYALCPNCCYGVLFNRTIFVIDMVSNFCYAMFPFYVYFVDDYNGFQTNSDIKLQINSSLMFVSIFVPLLFLGVECFRISVGIRQKMYHKYFFKWKKHTERNINDAKKHWKKHGYNLSSLKNDEIDYSKLKIPKSCIYNSDDYVNESYQPSKMKIFNQILIMLISFCFISFATIILLYTLNHQSTSEQYCHSITDTKLFTNTTVNSISNIDSKTLSDNPELYLWNKCLRKVYPFVNDEQLRCQCRKFSIDWETLSSTEEERKKHFNLTQEMILNGALSHWFMLEFFRTVGAIDSTARFRFISAMYKSVHMKAFEWRDTDVMSMGNGISLWSELEYLAFVNTSFVMKLPDDINGLQSLRYLFLKGNGLNELPKDICKLTQLQILQIQFEKDIESIPHCITELTELKAIWAEVTGLKQIPFSMFNLPNLLELSLFSGEIHFDNLLLYNNISFEKNESLEMDVWFNDNFMVNSYTDYWFTSNPICDEVLPTILKQFMNETCEQLCTFSSHYCSPRTMGDGKCTEECQMEQCHWDYGDCEQLCFAEELTSCTFDNFIQCDDECDNDFCAVDANYCIGA